MRRKWLLQLLIVSILSVVLLAVLSKLDGRLLENTAIHTVFAAGQPGELNDDNLVDGLIALQLPVPISKVDLNGGILSVDLKVTADQFDKSRLYAGMAELISFAFERTTNVDQLLLRLIAEDRWLGTKYLLLASDVHKNEMPQGALKMLRNHGDQELSDDLLRWFHITRTNLWRQSVN
ncbi:hypothetical protein [Paenibacillus lutimineralis]|uniref:DUF4825 domain-containing protein n=1 Tax=Paenibacillus lutimineralis TaxID=2707005 RepID=A0A3Q9IAJ4_9BACL|nr:hypothetical protein [Paenibacillus lutimineralis]AZS14813.1 hypothetical protein EI981_10310 [Paenibacillus lutimineralis]